MSGGAELGGNVQVLRSWETYFDVIDSEAKAYWLGFIFADGCVLWSERTGNYALQIGLGAIDVDHLVAFATDIDSVPLPRLDPRNGTVRQSWYSKYLVQRLLNLGIAPRKSATDHLPTFPRDLAQHFWRGVFDGDGCLAIQVKKPSAVPEYRVSLAGGAEILAAFQAWAHGVAGTRAQRIARARNSQGESKTYVFFMNGNRQIAALTSALYGGCTRMLARKYALHCALLEQNA